MKLGADANREAPLTHWIGAEPASNRLRALGLFAPLLRSLDGSTQRGHQVDHLSLLWRLWLLDQWYAFGLAQHQGFETGYRPPQPERVREATGQN